MPGPGKPFTKGKPGPGRPKDVPNKVTQVTREAFQMLVDGQFDNLNNWINAVAQDSPKDAFYMVMDLASHCVPKLKAIEVTGEVKQTVVRFVDAPDNH
jgi:hypothetical protein